MAIYIVKMGGLERLLDDMGFIPNLNINAENMHFLCFETLPTCAGSCLRTRVHAWYASLGLLLAFIFLKWIFCSLESYFFYFNISQVGL